MDFNTIYAQVAPYLGTAGIAGLIVTVITVLVRLKQLFTKSGLSLKELENNVTNAFKQALPENLYIEIEAITKKELQSIVENIKTVVDEKFLKQIKENTELMQAMAKALMSMKSIPDSAKEEIGKMLELPVTDTAKAMKVELIKPTITKKEEKTTEYPVM